MQEIKDELTGYMKEVEDFDKDSAQDGDVLNAFSIRLTNIMARSNYLMAEYKRAFRQKKQKAYYSLAASSQASQKYYSPTLAKDFIDAQCSEEGYLYDLAERTSRLCTHTLETLRTITMALMNERKFSNQYQ